MVSVGDFADRAPRGLADGEELSLGSHKIRWFDTPHVPHAWECGLMMDVTTRTFFCGDLFTQGGSGEVALTESDILGPSEAFRKPMDYYAHTPQTRATLERLAREAPTTLAVMHGSAWRGDGARLLASSRRARLARRASPPPEDRPHRTRRRITTHASRGTPRHRPWGSTPHIPVRRRPRDARVVLRRRLSRIAWRASGRASTLAAASDCLAARRALGATDGPDLAAAAAAAVEAVGTVGFEAGARRAGRHL